nr:A403 [uncultured bacterium]
MKFSKKEAKAWAIANVRDFYMRPPTPPRRPLFDEGASRGNIQAYLDMGLSGLVVGGFIAERWDVKFLYWVRGGCVKQSGICREGSSHGLDEYVEIKCVCLDGLHS